MRCPILAVSNKVCSGFHRSGGGKHRAWKMVEASQAFLGRGMRQALLIYETSKMEQSGKSREYTQESCEWSWAVVTKSALFFFKPNF